jgi:Aldehyde dehydrogenase family
MTRPDSSDHGRWRTGGSLEIGDPLDEKTDIGTIINNKQFTKVCRYVDEGLMRDRGVRLAPCPLFTCQRQQSRQPAMSAGQSRSIKPRCRA